MGRRFFAAPTYESRSLEKLQEYIAQGGHTRYVWTPESPGLVLAETVECIKGAVKEREKRGAKQGIRTGLLNTFIWGLLIVLDVTSGGPLPPFKFIMLLAFGVIPLTSQSAVLFRRNRLSFGQRGEAALFQYWMAKTKSRLLMAFVWGLVLISCMQLSSGLSDSVWAAGLLKPATRGGEYWRLLTCAFVHGPVFHILLNALALHYVGRLLMALSHHSLLPTTFLVSALTGSVFSLFLLPATTSVGASGGILGCLAFVGMLVCRRKDTGPRVLLKSVFAALGTTALIGLAGLGIIDNAAHLGGVVGGVGLGSIVLGRQDTDIPFIPNLFWRIVGALSWVMIFVIIAVTGVLVLASP